METAIDERQKELIDWLLNYIIKMRISVSIGFDAEGDFMISRKTDKGYKFISIDDNGSSMYSDSPYKGNGSREFSELGHETKSAANFVIKLCE